MHPTLWRHHAKICNRLVSWWEALCLIAKVFPKLYSLDCPLSAISMSDWRHCLHKMKVFILKQIVTFHIFVAMTSFPFHVPPLRANLKSTSRVIRTWMYDIKGNTDHQVDQVVAFLNEDYLCSVLPLRVHFLPMDPTDVAIGFVCYNLGV